MIQKKENQKANSPCLKQCSLQSSLFVPTETDPVGPQWRSTKPRQMSPRVRIECKSGHNDICATMVIILCWPPLLGGRDALSPGDTFRLYLFRRLPADMPAGPRRHPQPTYCCRVDFSLTSTHSLNSSFLRLLKVGLAFVLRCTRTLGGGIDGSLISWSHSQCLWWSPSECLLRWTRLLNWASCPCRARRWTSAHGDDPGIAWLWPGVKEQIHY